MPGTPPTRTLEQPAAARHSADHPGLDQSPAPRAERAGSLGRPMGRAQRNPEPDPAESRRTSPRRARLVLRRVDPWSVLKTSLVYSVCLLVVGVAAVAVLYAVLDRLGVLKSLASFLDTVTDAGPGTSTRSSFDASVVITAAAVILGINALLITALATLGAFLYNLCSSFTGGIEVTLAERD